MDPPKIRYNKEYKIQVRKKKLFECLNDQKLEYKKNGICDQYIQFGKISLEEVVENIQKREEIEMTRLELLLRKLKKYGAVYDENNTYYRDYIKKGGDLEETVRNGEIEWFYTTKTDYLEFLKIHKNEEIAQTKALNQYIEQNGTDNMTNKIMKRDLTISFLT
jgi:hypothetical protein